MSFVQNSAQQISFSDKYSSLSAREKKFLENSWAKGFSDIVFPAINEERFAVLFSDNPFSRPNTPVNIIIGAFFLKEMFGLTDDDLLESILFDIRFQYALHTTSFTEQPFSDRTASRFRERLYHYELETGRDLLKEEMVDLAEKMVEFMGINPTIKRMDSVMIASSCKKMSRLEIVYTCVSNLIKRIQREGREEILTPRLALYLQDSHKNNTLYRSKTEELELNLTKALEDAASLAGLCVGAYQETEEYHMLTRVLSEQAQFGEDGSLKPRHKSEIRTDSLQNPSDPDATFRRKAGVNHKGYVGNFVETTEGKKGIITQFGYEQNTHSDSAVSKEVVDELGVQEEKVILVGDGAYGGEDNVQHAKENNIDLIATALLGKAPDVILGDFVIDEEAHEVCYCPQRCVPEKTTYSPKQASYRVFFRKEDCDTCKNRSICRVKNQKKHAVVTITPKTVARAQYLRKLSTEEYKQFTKLRNAVEGIPSVLRRKYNVDHMPVRGFVRTKLWFTLKIGAMNVKRVLAEARSLLFASSKILLLNIINLKSQVIGTKSGLRVA